MALGISFDFRTFTWVVGSQSTQWWGPMAVAVIFGLVVAPMVAKSNSGAASITAGEISATSIRFIESSDASSPAVTRSRTTTS